MACASTLDVILSNAPCSVCDTIDMVLVLLRTVLFTQLYIGAGGPGQKREGRMKRLQFSGEQRQTLKYRKCIDVASTTVSAEAGNVSTLLRQGARFA